MIAQKIRTILGKPSSEDRDRMTAVIQNLRNLRNGCRPGETIHSIPLVCVEVIQPPGGVLMFRISDRPDGRVIGTIMDDTIHYGA